MAAAIMEGLDILLAGTIFSPERQLDAALKALRQAERDTPLIAIEEEFNRLFVGLGRGEMIPYASWYRERKIQSLPLASLRADLMQLSIIRQPDCHEPEDSAGALCEIMALISGKAEAVPPALQAKFFQTNLAPWMPNFFGICSRQRSPHFTGRWVYWASVSWKRRMNT